jgi:hypothetical protein
MRFRHSAGFGKRIEFRIIGQMLKEGLDLYVPLVDDNAIDAVVRRHDGSFVEVQIKARSRDVVRDEARAGVNRSTPLGALLIALDIYRQLLI